MQFANEGAEKARLEAEVAARKRKAEEQVKWEGESSSICEISSVVAVNANTYCSDDLPGLWLHLAPLPDPSLFCQIPSKKKEDSADTSPFLRSHTLTTYCTPLPLSLPFDL